MSTCPRKRREPEIIVFEEPAWSLNRNKKKRKLNQIDHEARAVQARRNKFEQNKISLDSEGVNIKETMREVQTLVSSSLEGKAKRKFEDELVKRLGGKGCKPDKMPYPLYQEVVKRRKEKQKREREEKQMMGLAAAPAKKGQTKPRARGRGWWQDKMKTLKPFGSASFKEGTLQLSERDLKKLKRK